MDKTTNPFATLLAGAVAALLNGGLYATGAVIVMRWLGVAI